MTIMTYPTATANNGAFPMPSLDDIEIVLVTLGSPPSG